MKLLLNQTVSVLCAESERYRPRMSAGGIPGGLLAFSDGVPFAVVPDLHARRDFLPALLDFRFPDSTATVLERLAGGEIRVVCLGDMLHSERRARERWLSAFDEWRAGNALNPALAAEMTEGLNLVSMLMMCKCAFPECFHILKGNHENILNTEKNGSHPFRKYAAEGEMTRDFFLKFYGEPILRLYAEFENHLPVFLKTARFLASHAEPFRCYSETELIDSYKNPEVMEGLTWTDNDAAQVDSVKDMLKMHCQGQPDSRYFGGHRAVAGRYALRAGGLFIQLHNPDIQQAAFVLPNKSFDPETSIYTVGGNGIA
ncbi:MAG: hypothetical protein NC041_00170 [Bacteroides sp.]|nr:hypothetical protein [Prevotella sp.]MCM1407782.1 hypothetical protein [Treponema brennaborense]MCM1468870.1 hypothetical protein [Bacteroides sp.]